MQINTAYPRPKTSLLIESLRQERGWGKREQFVCLRESIRGPAPPRGSCSTTALTAIGFLHSNSATQKCEQCEKMFSQCSLPRRHRLHSLGWPMSCRTSSCWSVPVSAWLSLMQQLQLCVEPTFTLTSRKTAVTTSFSQGCNQCIKPKERISAGLH